MPVNMAYWMYRLWYFSVNVFHPFIVVILSTKRRYWNGLNVTVIVIRN
ncbi:hypothetical protein BLA29_013040 [Euroglyphus maynei]|uniref:Uncharacterized protein n=1 Tax=Euroglyphus maynei TaxID=6958 RepID=A0A1Y3BLN0_EURMA|nr:hypothetical protein BLA29_013040 [Euroglyphus maynei]